MPQTGYDVFMADPGTVQGTHCRVCQTQCDVQREVYGPTSFATATAHDFGHHDMFRCPYAGIAWHEQALRLVVEIEATPSKRIAHLMQQDVADLLREHLSR